MNTAVRSINRVTWPVLRFGSALLMKGAILLKALKMAKFLKPMLTIASMALSTFAYAFWLGPWFSVGLVSMLFLHEMGHVWAVRRKGLAASAPIFIPFLGAAIFMPNVGNRDTEAYIGYGGPLVGTCAAVALLIPYAMLDPDTQAAHILLITCYAALFLNLFNMIPLSPLDGGRITQAVGPWFQYVGVSALLALTIFLHQPSILLIWVLVMQDLAMIPARARRVAMIVCAGSMSALMLLGFGTQPAVASAIDILIATLITGTTFLPDYEKTMQMQEQEEAARAQLSIEKRGLWLALYSMLLLGLILLMGTVGGLVPHEAIR